jgi:predicted nucleic acid-binding protein
VIIVDASVLTNALTDDGGAGQRGRAELAHDPHWSGPEHVIVETFSAVRGRHIGGKISQARAEDAIESLAAASIELLAVAPLLPRMWQLRDNIAAYDAAYVAAAETYDCPLVTADVRLAAASGLRCEIRLA